MTEETVRAAGGVVWRRRGDGEVEVLLVHRPRYDDWSFPKGKNDPGEDDAACALREVHEETGLTCALGEELPSATYVDGRGRPKVVRYWTMTVESAEHREPDAEVDEVAWLPLDEARRRLTYAFDVAILDEVRSRFTSRSPSPPSGVTDPS